MTRVVLSTGPVWTSFTTVSPSIRTSDVNRSSPLMFRMGENHSRQPGTPLGRLIGGDCVARVVPGSWVSMLFQMESFLVSTSNPWSAALAGGAGVVHWSNSPLWKLHAYVGFWKSGSGAIVLSVSVPGAARSTLLAP